MIVRDWHERRRIDRRSMIPMSVASTASGNSHREFGHGGSFADSASTPLVREQSHRKPNKVVDYGSSSPLALSAPQKQPAKVKSRLAQERPSNGTTKKHKNVPGSPADG
eukprot:325537_1